MLTSSSDITDHLAPQGIVPAWVSPLLHIQQAIQVENPGWTWTSGGCFAFADALSKATGGEQWGFCSLDAGYGDFPVEHAVVKIGELFYDHDGVVNVEKYLDSMSSGADRAHLLPATDEHVHWFEDDFLNDEQYAYLHQVLGEIFM